MNPEHVNKMQEIAKGITIEALLKKISEITATSNDDFLAQVREIPQFKELFPDKDKGDLFIVSVILHGSKTRRGKPNNLLERQDGGVELLERIEDELYKAFLSKSR